MKSGSSADVIKVNAVYCNIDSGGGDDYITVNTAGNQSINAGSGNNRVNSSSFSPSTVTATSGNDIIVATANRGVSINAGDGNNQIAFKSYAYPGSNFIMSDVTAGSGNDFIVDLCVGPSVINAGEGNNYIQFLNGVIYPSNSGNNDTKITAGLGRDTFNLGSNGGARITHFNSGDKIILADTAGVRVVDGSKAGEVEVYKGETLRAIVENSTVSLITRSVSAGSSRSYSPILRELLTANPLVQARDLQV